MSMKGQKSKVMSRVVQPLAISREGLGVTAPMHGPWSRPLAAASAPR